MFLHGITTENRNVIHAGSGKKFTTANSQQKLKVPVPAEIKLKDRKDFKLIGKAVRNVDNHEMITGKPLYGLDFYREGMLFAMIQRPTHLE